MLYGNFKRQTELNLLIYYKLAGIIKKTLSINLFKGLNLLAEVGERIAIIGPNGIGKTTLLRTLVNDFEPDSGTVKWSENANIGYYAQDHAADFAKDMNLFECQFQ